MIKNIPDKQPLLVIDPSNFTETQSIGSERIYNRYKSSVLPVLKQYVPQYVHFLAEPIANEDEDEIVWYVPKSSGSVPTRFAELDSSEQQKYASILSATKQAFETAKASASLQDKAILDSALKFIEEENIFCYDDFVVLAPWGMTLNRRMFNSIGEATKIVKTPKPTYTLLFHTDPQKGLINGQKDWSVKIAKGEAIASNHIPQVTNIKDGFVFEGWDPIPLGIVPSTNMDFNAIIKEKTVEPTPQPTPMPEPRVEPLREPEPEPAPKPERFECVFDAGEHGDINGTNVFYKYANYKFSPDEVPNVDAHEGYKFKGWDIDPTTTLVNGPITFRALYKKSLWQRIKDFFAAIWLWLTGKGCLKWLLWLLLFLLLLWLCSWLFNGCGCTRHGGVVSGYNEGVIGSDGSYQVHPIEQITAPGGGTIDNNNPGGASGGGMSSGSSNSIWDNGGSLPSTPVIPPTTGGDGISAPIAQRPGMPDIIANRLAVFFDEDGADMEGWCQKFKSLYPSDSYKIIGADVNSELIVIEIPESERDAIRENLPSQIPDQKFFVVDETLFNHVNYNAPSSGPHADAGWHIKSLRLKEAHNVTSGSNGIIIAIIDDGIEAEHPMFKGRIYKPYNVYLQSNQLSKGDGHGIHVAGIAAGNNVFESKGALGVAPDCMIMPVQVYDNNRCSMSAIASGVMYAIHQGAHIINVSSGHSLPQLAVLPETDQRTIANEYFKGEARVWNHIAEVAHKKNVTIVFAAGNDHILTLISPENRSNVSISVCATNSQGRMSEYTNYGEGSDISAPGDDIMSAAPNGKVQFMTGTSMAAPVISGTIALMRSVCPSIDAQQALTILKTTGCNVNGGNIPPYVNIEKAVKEAQRLCGDLPSSEESSTESSSGTTEDNVSQTDDYSEIRKLIEEYKRKIAELENMLPENKDK